MTQSVNPSDLLLERACTLLVGASGTGILITGGAQGFGLRVRFKVKRGVQVTKGATKPLANTCDLTIWNLSLSHQKALEQSTVPGASKQIVPVVLSAGYQGRPHVIFSGELRAGHTITDGPNAVTELSTGDGDQALTQQRITIALGKGSTAKQGLTQLLGALGIGQGNLQKGLELLAAQPLAAQMFQKGCVLKGQASELMTNFCRSVGLEWSIQNGALQITDLNAPVAGQAILLDSAHGLIGSPTVDTNGLLSCKTEMIPNLFPGTKLSINAQHVSGGFRVLNVETVGDTSGNEWGHNIEAQRY